jgi:hypothetical protein
MPTEKQRVLNYKKFSKYYTTTNGRASFLLCNARKRAAKAKVKCSITQAWIEEKLKKGVCEVTGIPLELHINGGKGSRSNSFSPSLDRISQTGDYSPENVRLTCWIYNRARGAFPDGDFERMLEALAHRHLA